MLNGIKVLSFTHFLQGPSAVQMLVDLGADVVKIESPKGAFERHWSGFDAFVNDVSVFFLLGNRNQRSLSIDLRTKEGKEIIYRMVKEADVLVENFRPGVMDRLGFSYEALKEINPRLVYCSCTGYGSEGPYLHRPGQDLLLQAISGLSLVSGGKDAPPTPVGSAIVDQHAAVLAAFGIVSSLLSREKTGQGRKVESNLLNAALDLQIEPLTYYLNKGPLWERSDLGSRFHQAPYGIYQTNDGWIAISMTPIEKLKKAFNNNELEQYTSQDQMEKREEVNQIVSQVIKQKSTDYWFSAFEDNDIWCSPVNSYEEVEKDPQVEWNKMIMTVNHPDAGQVRLLNHPVRYENHELGVSQHPPRLGEHTIEVLHEYGYSEEEIEKFLQSGVVIENQRKLERTGG
ncbi:CaiB/BaiF CoA-transferase family protein [Fictibacillus enclensis]|uniref:CaiB/BaiF CoA transferase family protein n=1 Tax=Fictibacillus enclensis TaxID=1017270 RepID=UPI0025A2C01D|nr:CaiB/BaiF CoA-transferase family protein [Fictibacillus enclensis]MDM5201123.1 CaiB/BaiF CoA-transferase family protein [Fictibacillus enclensis]